MQKQIIRWERRIKYISPVILEEIILIIQTSLVSIGGMQPARCGGTIFSLTIFFGKHRSSTATTIDPTTSHPEPLNSTSLPYEMKTSRPISGTYITSDNTLKFGISSIYHTFLPGSITASSTSSFNSFTIENRYALENAAYISDNDNVFTGLKLNYGLGTQPFLS